MPWINLPFSLWYWSCSYCNSIHSWRAQCVPPVQIWSAVAELLPSIHHTPKHCQIAWDTTGWVYFKQTGKHVLNPAISGIFGHHSLQLWAVLCQLCPSNHLPRESFHTALGSLTAAVNQWLAHPRRIQLLQMNISVFWDYNSPFPLKLSLWC